MHACPPQISSYGIDERDEVHELEFLSLVAFIAREAISLRGSSKSKKFSANDLEMAYAFRSKFGRHEHHERQTSALAQLGGGINVSPRHIRSPGGHQISPSHRITLPPQYQLDTSPMMRNSFNAPAGLSQQQRDSTLSGHRHMQSGQAGGLLGAGGQVPLREYTGHGESLALGEQKHDLGQNPRYSGQQGTQYEGSPPGQSTQQQDRDEQRMSMLLATNPSQYSPPQPPPPQQQQQQQQSGQMMSPSHMQLYQGMSGRDMLDASRTSGELKLMPLIGTSWGWILCPLKRGCPLLGGDKCTITMGSGRGCPLLGGDKCTITIWEEITT